MGEKLNFFKKSLLLKSKGNRSLKMGKIVNVSNI